MIDELNRIQEKLNKITQPKPKTNSIDLHYIQKCCGYLRKMGIIRNQYQFSENFMGKNKYYYGMVLSEQRQPSIDALYHLIKKMSVVQELYESEADKRSEASYLQSLIEEGHTVITKRLFKYL